MTSEIIRVEKLKTYLGNHWVHKEVSFSINAGEIIALVGGSGCGKSTLLREMLNLLKPQSGAIEIFKQNILRISPKAFKKIQQRWGILFQQGALFSSLTVLENISFPLKEFTHLNSDTIKEVALLKLALVGLSSDTANKYPAELSGGMQKRVALARAIALDPELLFLDEPSSGLDPVSAIAQDKLLLQLKQALRLTIVMVTHDVNTLATITDRIIFLGEGRVLADGTYHELKNSPIKEVYEYFHSEKVKK